MGFFYFDESIHTRGGFILGAWIYAPRDLGPEIHRILESCGFAPGVDEFKSRLRMDSDPRHAKLRDTLRQLFPWEAKVGLVVIPDSHRGVLAYEALAGLRKIVQAGGIAETEHAVILDQGILPKGLNAQEVARAAGLPNLCDLHFEQDSRIEAGLQLADLAAHAASIVLLERMGLVTKTVKAGPNSGYDPDLQLEIGFELWAGLRWAFISGGLPRDVESNQQMVVDVENYGLYVSPLCGEQLQAVVRSTFGKCYLGCIH